MEREREEESKTCAGTHIHIPRTHAAKVTATTRIRKLRGEGSRRRQVRETNKSKKRVSEESALHLWRVRDTHAHTHAHTIECSTPKQQIHKNTSEAEEAKRESHTTH